MALSHMTSKATSSVRPPARMRIGTVISETVRSNAVGHARSSRPSGAGDARDSAEACSCEHSSAASPLARNCDWGKWLGKSETLRCDEP